MPFGILCLALLKDGELVTPSLILFHVIVQSKGEIMKRTVISAACIAAALALTACASYQTGGGATAQLQPRSGSVMQGNVVLTQVGDKIRFEVLASNVPPGQHGFHVHEVGDCSAADAASAKGHYNPTAKQHGSAESVEHHAGDLKNLVADATGNVRQVDEVVGLKISELVGRSLVVHADPDDYASQPAGNSGKRIGCCVITAR
ncbi:MAG TPA: superoxide dismutase family protein [Pseudomonas sp.]|nr:superoxide dismutase family protein [Pseudomonas sp.]